MCVYIWREGVRVSRNRIWEVAGDVASVVLVLVLLEEEQLGGLKSDPKIRGKKGLSGNPGEQSKEENG